MTTDTKHKYSLKAKDLDMIIKAAKEAGVTHFRYGDLEISFQQKQEEHQMVQAHTPPRPEPKPDGGIPIFSEEEQANELLLMDPLGYEEKIAQELEASEG